MRIDRRPPGDAGHRRSRDREQEIVIRLSIIIPAHNEEVVVGSTIRSARHAASAAGVPFEILVVDDASTDRTVATAEAEGARVVHVNVRHIARARNAGAAVARGEMLLFVDADTLVTAAAVTSAVGAMQGGAVGGGSAARLDEPVPAYARIVMRVLVGAMRWQRMAFGCFFFCTKRSFDAVGGFDERMFAAEELAMSRALRKQGRFVILRESVITSGRKVRTHSSWELLKIFVQISAGGLRGVKDRRRLDLWYAPRRRDGG
jgi:glycosyltransferase involved in cell wall biosynthesis